MADDASNIFDVAKKVNDQLSSLQKNEQVKVLRWVAESLGVQITPQAASSTSQVLSEAPSHPVTETPAVPATPPNQPTDIRTFVEEKQPKSDNQFAAVVAYYYRFKAPDQDRSETITAEMLQNAARLSRRHVPGKPSVTLNNAERQGYLDRVDRGHFGISTVGENLVAMTLPSTDGNDNAKTTTRRPRSRKNSGAKKTAKKSKSKVSRKSSRKKQ